MIRLRLMWEDDADRTVPLPAYATPGAAGADIRANLNPADRATGLTLAPMQRRVVPTGFRLEIPTGYEAQIRPRSGLALHHGITLPNTPATIDSDYRGPLGIALVNLSDTPFLVEHGARIAQMVVAPVLRASFEVAHALTPTARGAGGFGSTGTGSMLPMLALGAALWGLGAALRTPHSLRLAMIGALWVAVVALHLTLPQAHPLRVATGGEARVWLALGVVAAMVFGYRAVLGRLRHRVAPSAAPAPTGTFRPAELDRYARHIALREIGGTGQRRLKSARVLVIGAGGLGSPALLYLAAAGVGTIGVIDDDVVENTNLQRQVIHTDARIGMPKVFSAEIAMRALNPFIEVRPYHRRLTAEIAQDLFADHDLILDGSDNFDTRYLVNKAAVATGRPLIAAAITQWEGQLSLYHPAAGGPCFACVFPNRPAPGLVPTCAEAGVAAPLPGVIGAMMAMEAVKHLTGAGETLRGRLMIHDALYGETRVIAARRRPDCPVCGSAA